MGQHLLIEKPEMLKASVKRSTFCSPTILHGFLLQDLVELLYVVEIQHLQDQSLNRNTLLKVSLVTLSFRSIALNKYF